ncbi:MAG: DUF420 domain-containing protein [Paenibacillaceae bacterium]|jgi:putative membrane protein|nr:DUF420 domain-containing protein [Paenibacillaceae bacterium]
MGNKQQSYTAAVVTVSIVINALVAALFFLPKASHMDHIDVLWLPTLNAFLNSCTFVLLLCAYWFIRKKNVVYHRRSIGGAFVTTTLFLISYVTYHYATQSTPYGGEGFMRAVYFSVLISHILLAIVIVPMALFTALWGMTGQHERHRRIARWTMPLWLYVSATGVLVYVMISPYYPVP